VKSCSRKKVLEEKSSKEGEESQAVVSKRVGDEWDNFFYREVGQ
jgi:hypothetical protein